VGSPALIDAWLPRFDEVERHDILVRAAPEDVYAALRRVDLKGSWIVRGLLLLRGLPPGRGRSCEPFTLERLLANGFTLLGERPGRELALGVVGRFWTPSGGRLRLDADAFGAFERPGYAKAVIDFRLAPEADGVTRLSTETRILCLDAPSRRRFRLYWRAIGPFSALIRRAWLRAVAREATRPGAAPSPSRR
jgi:hypothetical protein